MLSSSSVPQYNIQSTKMCFELSKIDSKPRSTTNSLNYVWSGTILSYVTYVKAILRKYAETPKAQSEA